LLPELATLDFSPEQEKLVKEFKNPKPSREVSLIMPRKFMKRKLMEVLKQTIIENIPDKIKQVEKGRIVSWERNSH